MKALTPALLGICIAAALTIGCSAASSHKVLNFFFDGVPPPKQAKSAGGEQVSGAQAVAQTRTIGHYEHGPYAAKLCNGCHQAGATGSLVAPRDQLCIRCHDIPLDKKFIHGPLASGGCLACHDPHSSRFRYLLVSESDSFCFRCHERSNIAMNPAHDGASEQCTTCHNAHASDTKYLLN